MSLSLVILSCNTKDNIPKPTNLFSFETPSYIPKPFYQFTNNPLTKNGFELGKLLFYDPILSSDSSISCASCHFQSHAFADHNLAFSKGVNNLIGKRNSPALFNLAWNTSFMWDGGINHIETMPLAPITNHLEMNESINHVLEKLNRNNVYKKRFKLAFNIDSINDQKMFYALAQFIGNLQSFNSKYDKVRQRKSIFYEDENSGYILFKNHCQSCHTEPLFTNFEYANNGIDSIYVDQGRFLITQNPSDIGKFKIPSLRNIALTFPYMHDGRFSTLEKVIEHYTENISPVSNVDIRLKNTIKLNAKEKQELLAFLNTLTDFEFIQNKIYTKP
jgi:cytochrome c peroxidase